jgi:hypothetical protein
MDFRIAQSVFWHAVVVKPNIDIENGKISPVFVRGVDRGVRTLKPASERLGNQGWISGIRKEYWGYSFAKNKA